MGEVGEWWAMAMVAAEEVEEEEGESNRMDNGGCPAAWAAMQKIWFGEEGGSYH